MNKAPFTQEQKDWICYMIGEWYLLWKKKISPGQKHNLGIAKEHLKEILFEDYE